MKRLFGLVLMALSMSLCGCGGGTSAEPPNEEELAKQQTKDQQEAARIQALPVVPAN